MTTAVLGHCVLSIQTPFDVHTDAFFIDTCCWVCVVVFYLSVMKSLSTIVIRNWTKRKGTWNLAALKNDCYGQFASSLNRSSDRQRLLQDLTEDEFGLFHAVYESRTFVGSKAIAANNYWQYSSFPFLIVRFSLKKK